MSLLLVLVLSLSLVACSNGGNNQAVLDEQKAEAAVREYLEFILDPASYTEMREKMGRDQKGWADSGYAADYKREFNAKESEFYKKAYSYHDPRVFADMDAFLAPDMSNPVTNLFSNTLQCLINYNLTGEDQQLTLQRFELKELTRKHSDTSYNGKYELDVLTQTYLLKGTFHTGYNSYDIENEVDVHVTVNENGEHLLKMLNIKVNGEKGIGYLIMHLQEQTA